VEVPAVSAIQQQMLMEAPPSPLSSRAQPRDLQFNLSDPTNLSSRPKRRDLLFSSTNEYRGRLAPSPTGFLHLGHARTFWLAQRRAVAGVLILRDEDLDPERSQPHFRQAMLEDLRWLGLQWQEGPDVGGPFGPYTQSQRQSLYQDAWHRLRAGGWLYLPSSHSFVRRSRYTSRR
jgi:glutamyl/glutaminyl-tRNA synthetase